MTRTQRIWIVAGLVALAVGIAIGYFVIRPLPHEKLIEEQPMTSPVPDDSTLVKPPGRVDGAIVTEEPGNGGAATTGGAAEPSEGESPAPRDTTSRSTLIVLERPRRNALATSPLRVEGRARGTWYFEAEFPVRLLDESGAQITWGSGRAQGDWMTSEFVPFSVVLEFAAPATDRGTLVLERSNPSGLPQNAAEVRIPLRFR